MEGISICNHLCSILVDNYKFKEKIKNDVFWNIILVKKSPSNVDKF